MTGPADPWQPPPSGDPAPPAGPPASSTPAYGTPAYGTTYAAPSSPWGAAGPAGQVRPTGRCVLLFFVTLGIYAYVWNYKVHSEMKTHSGRGIGGGIALLLTFLAGIAMPFVTASEVGGLYSRRGSPEPVRGWTGLWLLLPALGGYLAMFVVMLAIGASSPTGEPSDGAFVGFGVLMVLWLVGTLIGGLVWFVRTNGALNRYWASLSPSPTGAGWS